jgi:alpha-tubulin suppressor-like RCC1 family protein
LLLTVLQLFICLQNLCPYPTTMKKIYFLAVLLICQHTFSQCYSTAASKGFHNLVIKTDGALWAWGQNNENQIGNNLSTNQLTPLQIGTDNSWISLSAGTYYSVGIKSDGTLWAWGDNDYGQSSPSGTPQMIGSDNDWVAVSAGLGFTSAIKSDGTLWIWGFNMYGQLGNGTTVNSNTPAQVGTDTDWVAVSNGSQHVMALKSDGTLWAWGMDDQGCLGLGNLSDQHIPVQVGTANDWTKIYAGYSSSAAIKSDGTLWVWGYNEYGMIGDGTTTNKQSPIQIGSDTNWKSVAITTHTMAIKTDGTLWAWGRNNYGKIGNGLSSGNQLTPVQIGTDTDWVQAIPGFEHSIAIKGNGTIYTWGHNNFGQLGDGTTVDKIVPTQIGISCSETLCTVTPANLLVVTGECSLELANLPIPTSVDSCGNTITASLYTGSFPVTENSTIVWKFGNGATAVYKQQDIVIQDTQAPLPAVTNLPTITGQCMVNAGDIIAPTAEDSCAGIITATTNTLDFDEQGAYNITWTYDDGHGNTASQNQQVIINDTEMPTVVAQPITVDLNGESSVTITPEQVNNGSTDNCGALVLEIDTATFSTPGIYNVLLTATDTGGNTASDLAVLTIIDSTAGINDIELQGFSIYPVPAKDWLYIKKTDGMIIMSIQIYDTLGRRMLQFTDVGEKIDISSLAKANYLVVVTTNMGTVKKFLIVD